MCCPLHNCNSNVKNEALCKILLDFMHFEMIEARKSFNNFDAKVTLATTLTQFETNMGESSMKLSNVHTIACKTVKQKKRGNLENITDQVIYTDSEIKKKDVPLKFTSPRS